MRLPPDHAPEPSFEQNGDGLDIGLGLRKAVKNNKKVVMIKNKKQIIKSKIVHKILIKNNFLVRLLELP